MSVLDKFKALDAAGADYWDCDDTSESLTHSDALEAIESYFERCWPAQSVMSAPDFDAEAWLREETGEEGLTVYAFLRSKVTDEQVDTWVDDIQSRVAECFSEDYGDPDGGNDGFTTEVFEKHKPAFAAVVRALVDDASVWRCEPCGKVELTEDEAVALMREHRPDWFEPNGGGA